MHDNRFDNDMSSTFMQEYVNAKPTNRNSDNKSGSLISQIKKNKF